jgi:hypothetical protein
MQVRASVSITLPLSYMLLLRAVSNTADVYAAAID